MGFLAAYQSKLSHFDLKWQQYDREKKTLSDQILVFTDKAANLNPTTVKEAKVNRSEINTSVRSSVVCLYICIYLCICVCVRVCVCACICSLCVYWCNTTKCFKFECSLKSSKFKILIM